MEKRIQVKGTLPLVADYLGATEQKVYSIFNLDLKKEETEVGSTKEKRGGKKDGTTNKGKAVSTSKDSV
ncbi:MAG: hypothetical protein IJ809_05455 [Clostridia bacterium]|nr:hypothetical protein [Clostridia bacterium]